MILTKRNSRQWKEILESNSDIKERNVSKNVANMLINPNSHKAIKNNSVCMKKIKDKHEFLDIPESSCLNRVNIFLCVMLYM